MFDHMLADKVVFVTGASRGLGRALCEKMAGYGAHVAFNYVSDEDGAMQTRQQVQSHGRRCLALRASVLDEASMTQAIEETQQQLGPIDILVNNAGTSEMLPLALTDADDWDRVVDLNLKGQFLSARAVIPGMIKRRRGVLLNMGSLAGLRLLESPVTYSASKAGVKGLTDSLCKELAPYGIRVNCLAPGLLDDGIGRNIPPYRLEDYVRFTAMKRLGTLQEVAELAGFMVSDLNAYMNGETVIMSGGF